MTLYLKYRPKNLEELDETSVSESLKKIVSKKSFPHAFLFAGPKGTGKTSAARILAKIINCQSVSKKLRGANLTSPCDKCDQCISITKGSNLDVVEMDAASHRGIDDVRVLRDAVKLSPVAAKNKVYIIDEVHMLTTEAENALLKTLEEPPPHVYFILATTNPEKLIETIRSRVSLIPFKKASSQEIVNSLKKVAKGEKIKIDDDALKLIADASDGSFRDAIKTLEQFVTEEKDLSKSSLEELLYKNKTFNLDEFVGYLAKRDIGKLLSEVEGLTEKGVSISLFVESLLKKLRIGLLAKVGIGEDLLGEFSKRELVTLVELLNNTFFQINESPLEELPLELALISWCGDSVQESPDDQGEKTTQTKGSLTAIKTSSLSSKKTSNGTNTEVVIQTQEQVEIPGEVGVDGTVWKNILDLVKPINASMEALLKAAKPVSYNGKVLTLGVYYKFHKERLEDSHHRKLLEDVIAKVLQSPTRVTCVLVEPPPKKVMDTTKADTILTEGKDADIIKAAEEIFGN